MSRVALDEPILLATNPASFAIGREVYVYNRGTEVLAALYSGESGGAAVAQPLTTNAAGVPVGSSGAVTWAEEGSYDLEVEPRLAGEDSQILYWEAARGGGLPVSAMEFKGGWNAATNTPALADGTGNVGDFYRVMVGGSRNLGSGSIDFSVGDDVVYDGSVWFKVGGAGAVASVNGKTGAVTGLEETANKVQVLSGESESEYPSEKAVQLGLAAKQPLDSDLSAIAALGTTAFGRSFLELIDAAGGRTLLGLGSAATQPSTAFDAAGAAAAAQAASQPLDSDLTAIAALSTTSFGRALLALADAAAVRAAIGAAATGEIAEVETASLSESDTKVPSSKLVKTSIAVKGSRMGRGLWRPEGTKAETVPRSLGELKNSAILTSGTLLLAGGLELPAGLEIKEVHFYSATTAATSPTNQWAVLLDSSRKVLARSADKTTEAWAANSKKTFTLDSPYTTTEEAAFYVGIVVVASTVPTLQAKESINSFPLNLAPVMGGNSNTGLTVPSGLAIGATASAINGTVRVAYATVN